MPLSAGTRLGAYEIVSPIGAGGMGEVYSAKDTRLNRLVAIKTSNEQFTERFGQEARAVAALNHPNICQLYDVGPNYLVMELIEGEELKGPLPLDDALKIASQIIGALEAAHEKGIVHRDLKPANIRVTPEGIVKVLDFGLAKALEPEQTGSPETSPTLTMRATQAGMILGTAAYMAPEQARGKSVDRRADIWSFGVVLYEMIMGRQAFAGEDVTEILAAVLKQEPDWNGVPVRVQRLLKSCLQKDPRKRLQAIGDARLLLEDPAAEAVVAAPSRSRFGWVAWAVAAAGILIAAGIGVVHFRETPLDQPVLRFSIPLPSNQTLAGFLAISPDGRRLAVSLYQGGQYQIWLRSLDAQQFQLLSGTENSRSPFWSADSRFIGFFVDGKLKTVPAAGGPAQALCGETGLGTGGAWNRDGVILFGSETGPLRRVSAGGGECVPVTKADSGARDSFPEFLPDGKHFLYFHLTRDDESLRGVYVAALDHPEGRKVLSDNSNALFAPAAAGEREGHLLFFREGNLMAQSFDAITLQTVGDPFVVTGQASLSSTPPQVAASLASNGTLAYLANRALDFQLTWFDRSGKELGKVGPRGDLLGVSLSPDGNTVAFPRRNQGLWFYDFVRGSETRFSTSQSPVVWSPDGSRIALSSAALQGLIMKPASGGGQEESLLKTADRTSASDWSRDGRFLVYTKIDAKANVDIWYLPDPGKPDSKPVTFLGTDAMESQGQLSPDGHWIAYVSNETGKQEIYMRPFPSGPGQRKVSASSGREPRWSRDGKEVFFIVAGAPQALLAASVQPDEGGGPKVGIPHKLFEFRGLGIVPQANEFSYSPHPDGKRFLVSAQVDTGEPTINVITNWRRAVARAAER